MKRQNKNKMKAINVLVHEYEAMSQKETVGFIEETVFNELIKYYVDKDLIDQALDVIDLAIVQHKYSIDFYLNKVQILLYNESYEEAMEVLETASVFSPGSVQIALLKVKALTELEFYTDAFEIIDTTKQHALGEALSNAFYYEAELYERQAKYQRMYGALHTALTIFPNNQPALELIMWAVELNGNYQESVELYQALIDEHPYSDKAWFNLGQSYTCLEEYDLAIEAFEYAFIINKENEYAYRECAGTHIKLKQFNQALKIYQEAGDILKKDADALINMGFCYESLRDVKTARSYYAKAIKRAPQNAEAYYRLGECHAKTNAWPKAVKAYKRARHLDSRKEEYAVGLAEAFYQTNQVAKARDLFQKAADMAPETSIYWLQYASFLLDIGEAETAIDLLDEAVCYCPGPEVNYHRLACLFYIGRKPEALYYLEDNLIENYQLHTILFDLVPSLAIDEDVLRLVEKFKRLD